MEEILQANPVGIIKKDIYVIKNDVNDMVYVGQTKNTLNRFKQHIRDGGNSRIAKAIKEIGKEHFYVEVLESQIENYDEREIFWINKLNSKCPNGYNFSKGGVDPPHYHGDLSSSSMLKDRELTRLYYDLQHTNISLGKLASKYGISKRQVLRINNGTSRGSSFFEYPLRKIPNINGKLTEKDVDEIIHLLKFSYKFDGEIAKMYGVNSRAISEINSGKSHKRANEKYPIRCWKSCGMILFTYEQVTEIIDLLKNTKTSINKIAKKFNVTPNSIYLINSGKSKKYHRDGLDYPIRKF